MATISASPRVVVGSLDGSIRVTGERPVRDTPRDNVPSVGRGRRVVPESWRLVGAGLVLFLLALALFGVVARAASQAVTAAAPVATAAPVAESAAYPAWTVAPGDTLWGIARATAPDADPRATVEVLRTLNGFDAQHVLQVGDVLQLPTA